MHYTDIILHVIHLVIIPYSIDNHARSGICEIQKTMRKTTRVPRCQGWGREEGRGKVCTFHECMLKDNHKNTAHTGNGKWEMTQLFCGKRDEHGAVNGGDNGN